MAKTVLITGCSSGIGYLTARLFAARGWNVIATARRPETLSEFMGRANVLPLPLDVTNGESIRAAVDAAIAGFGSIDVLVNNAGYGLFGPLEGMSGGELEGQFATNVFGLAAVTRAVLPGMRERRDGTIVNVSSVAGTLEFPFGSAYIASKHAVNGLSKSMRHELRLFGIRVKLVEPGAFRTEFAGGSRTVDHPAYARAMERFRKVVERETAKAPTAEPVAETIFRAANDRSYRLHFPVRGRPLMLLHAFLPDRMWRGVLHRVLTPRGERPAA